MVPHGPINFYHSFEWNNLILCLYYVNTLNICMKNLDNFSLIGLLYICIDGAFMGRSTPTTAFDGAF